jgi:membrane-bound serine protease (ClpP class)
MLRDMMPIRALLLACLAVFAAAAEPAAAPAPVEPETITAPAAGPAVAPAPLVAYIPIDGVIDDHRAGQFQRALDRVLAANPRYIVCRVATDGGHLGSAMEMLERILKAGDADTELIAFIDNRAYSAGALISYGHRRVYMTDQAYIGDIGVITISQEGKIEYLPEKIESPVRALLRQAGQHNGWDQAKLQKMTARNQELWRFDLDGKRHFVIEDDLPAFLAERPGLTREQGVLISGKDRLLTYTAKEAVAEGMATALVADIDAVYRLLGVEPSQVQRFEPSTNERIAETLGGWAPLLAGLAVLLLILEFKMPSGGLFLIGAGILGAAFLVCQYWLDLAGAPEMILIGLGIAAVLVEVFLLPTGGILAIGGLLGIGAGLILAFMPDSYQFQVGDTRWGSAVGDALVSSLLALTVLTVGVIMAIAALPRTRAMRVLASAAAVDGTSAGAVESAAPALVGRRARARTMLRPSGFVVLDGRDLGAVAEHGAMIAEGSEVEVVGTAFGELVVRPVDAGGGRPA